MEIIMSALMLLVQIWIMYKFGDNPYPFKDPFPENAQSMLSHFVSSPQDVPHVRRRMHNAHACCQGRYIAMSDNMLSREVC